MRSIINFIWSLFWVVVILMIIFLKIVVGLIVVIMASVPLTFLYAKLTHRSYSFTIDQSSFLYRINQIGKFLWFIFLCYLIGIWIYRP